MALTFKLLQTGTLGALATLYPSAVVAGKNAIAKSIVLTNTGATVATVNLYVNKQATGGDTQISPKDVQLPAGAQLILDTEIGLLLDTGPDQIRGSASGSTVQYVITGLERDIS